MRCKLIACEVLFREMSHACAHAPGQVDLEFLPMGLHEMGGNPMAARLQEAVDRTPPGVYQAILLGYGLCGNALDGLRARHTRLVLPRAHDCIALLMGGLERYLAYFEDNPGTYYRSIGWLERGRGLRQLTPAASPLDQSREALIARYGEDDGSYLHQQLTGYQARYRKLTFIETGLEAGGEFLAEAAGEAAGKGWSFEKFPGDLGWLRRLVSGDWTDAEFAIAEPGQRFAARYDGRVVEAVG